jgi:1-acyl-sn-glycerol-3-phosphate acyltransferase
MWYGKRKILIMQHSLPFRFLLNVVLPFIFFVLILSVPVSIWQWHSGLYNGFYVTLGFIGVSLAGVVINYYTALQEIERPKGVKIFFTITSGISFLVVYLFIAVSIIIILKWFKKYASQATSFMARVATISMGVFVFSYGEVKAYRKEKKKATIMIHKGSLDYVLMGLVGWGGYFLIMIGANLWKWRPFRKFFDAVGVPVHRDDPKAQLHAPDVRKIFSFVDNHENANIIGAPEGTRGRDEEILDFLDGIFSLAKKKNLAIYPIVPIGVNKIRKPGEKITASFADEKFEWREKTLKDVWNLILYIFKLIFKEGINPGIVRLYYLEKISTEGKEVEEISAEAKEKMKKVYDFYSKRKIKLFNFQPAAMI